MPQLSDRVYINASFNATFALFFMVTLKTLICKSKCCATRVLIIAFVPHPLISLKYHMQLTKPPSVWRMPQPSFKANIEDIIFPRHP